MAEKSKEPHYRATETQFKGRADEMYVTYDLEQKTRGNGRAFYPKVKRVYIAGKVQGWKVGEAKKRSGRQVYGVTIEYEQSRSGYSRREFMAKRGKTTYRVNPTKVKASSQKFWKVVEVPKEAQNIHFYPDPKKTS